MTKLEKLRTAKDVSDLARLLNFTPKGLAYVLYRMPAASRYRTFEIPKKSGGARVINAPNDHLHYLQRCLATLLVSCVEEIEEATPARKSVSHAFHRGRSTITNARAHRSQRYVLNLDLKDFFGTINFGRVRGYFMADRNFALAEKVATAIAQIACHENALPQGAPSSPVISNLIGHILDMRLIALAKEHGCTYTRYADDLTFSTRRKEFPRQLARPSKASEGVWILGKPLKGAIKSAGFAINLKKTRMQIRGSRQLATGLIVNEKVNIRQESYRQVRSMCHALYRTGQYHISNKEDGATIDKLSPLEGRLAHIYYVKSRRDRPLRINSLERFEAPRAVTELYRRFLFYKYFVGAELAVLVTEGKTDVTYLKAAIRSLHKKFPRLVSREGKAYKFALRFLNSTYTNQAVLGLGAGFGGMPGLIESYSKRLEKYAHQPLLQPVVLVVDNDSGGEKVLKAASKASNKAVTADSVEPFYHIRDNLYLVKTPPTANGQMSSMEDLFPGEVLARKLEGKPFDRNKKHGDTAAYGKFYFADKVVRPEWEKIDFSKFVPILDGLSKAIEDYAKKLAEKKVKAKVKTA